MRRPRFRLRTLMVAVAAIGLTIGGIQNGNRMRLRLIYAARARMHAEKVSQARSSMLSRGVRSDALHHGATSPWYLATYKDVINYHSTMRDKYERAARRPWLPVAPDPPEP